MASPLTSPSAVISVVGSLNVDLVTRIVRIPRAGETLTAESFDIGFGGKGANQAVACARLSRMQEQALKGEKVDIEVRMVGAVGDDPFAADFLTSLQKDGLNTGHVKKLANTKTGVAAITVETQTGENRIMFSPGANYKVEKTDLLPKDTTLALFQLELPLEVVLLNMKIAREHGIETALNPAPAVPLPDEAYHGLGHLIVNETEAALLSDISNPTDWNEVASTFISKGVKNVIITLGGDGVCYQNAQRHAEGQSAKMVPALKVQVVDTTAAGDTFLGAYAVAVARETATSNQNLDIDAAINFANRAASKTVQTKGAQSSIPWLDEVP